MTRLCTNSTPAERRRFCKFAETFESAGKVVRNNATIIGAPSIHFGAVLDGTNDYFTYPVDGQGANAFNNNHLSFVIEFIPDFDYDEDADRYLFLAGNPIASIIKEDNAANNVLTLTLGGVAIASIAEATYSDYWLVDERNVLVVSAASENTSAWLNGTEILANDATAWTSGPASVRFNIGASAGLSPFDGTISQFKIFHSLLTADEALDYYNYGVL